MKLSLAEQMALPAPYVDPASYAAAEHIPLPSRERAEALAASIKPKLAGLEIFNAEGKVVGYQITADPSRFTKEELDSMLYPIVPKAMIADLDAKLGTPASVLAVVYSLVQGFMHPAATAGGLALGALTAMIASYPISSYTGHIHYDKYAIGSPEQISTAHKEAQSHHLRPYFHAKLTPEEDRRKASGSGLAIAALIPTLALLEGGMPPGPWKAALRGYLVGAATAGRAFYHLAAISHRAGHLVSRAFAAKSNNTPERMVRSELIEAAQAHRILTSDHLHKHHRGDWTTSYRLLHPFPFPGGQHLEKGATGALNAIWRGLMHFVPSDSAYAKLDAERLSEWLADASNLHYLRTNGRLPTDWLEFPEKIPAAVLEELLADPELMRTALCPAFWTRASRRKNAELPEPLRAMLARRAQP